LTGADPVALRRDGVGWLVVEVGTPGDMGSAARTFERLPVIYRGQDLVLYRVGGTAAGVPADRRLLAVIAHLLWLATLIGTLIGTTVVFGRFTLIVGWTGRPVCSPRLGPRSARPRRKPTLSSK
jgi:hypothetical protein